MQVNPEDGPPEIYVTLADPRMTDFENWQNFWGDLPYFALKCDNLPNDCKNKQSIITKHIWLFPC